tara:strand:- start:11569 stop:12291 length:723 start_codon:yes stop_codon:yes gene_type:complete
MSKIPKIIHQIWIGDKKIPPHCEQFTKEMKAMHPDWEYHLWDHDKIFNNLYKNDRYLQHYIKQPDIFKYAYISDRIRLLLLRDFGGVYVDVDAKPIRPFDLILDKCSDKITFFAGMKMTDDNIKSWMMDCTVYGSAPHSRAINLCLNTYTTINWANGGFMFSEILLRNIDDDMLALAPNYFYSSKITNKSIILHDVPDTRLWTWFDRNDNNMSSWFAANKEKILKTQNKISEQQPNLYKK